jgi:hypothetical protein
VIGSALDLGTLIVAGTVGLEIGNVKTAAPTLPEGTGDFDFLPKFGEA